MKINDLAMSQGLTEAPGSSKGSDNGQVNDGHDHEQGHQTHREGGVAFGQLHQFGQERGAGCSADDDQAGSQAIIQGDDKL